MGFGMVKMQTKTAVKLKFLHTDTVIEITFFEIS